MPQVAGQNGQPVALGGGGDDDIGEAGGMAMARGVLWYAAHWIGRGLY